MAPISRGAPAFGGCRAVELGAGATALPALTLAHAGPASYSSNLQMSLCNNIQGQNIQGRS